MLIRTHFRQGHFHDSLNLPHIFERILTLNFRVVENFMKFLSYTTESYNVKVIPIRNLSLLSLSITQRLPCMVKRSYNLKIFTYLHFSCSDKSFILFSIY